MIGKINLISNEVLGFLGVIAGSLSGIVIAIINNKRNKTLVHKEEEDVLSLRNHDIFNTLKRVEYEVVSMKFYTDKKYDKVKTAMCHDFTVSKIKHCGELMLDMLDTQGVDSMNKDKLKSFVISKQMEMHENYIRDIRSHWSSKNIISEDIDYVLRLFDSFRYDVIKAFEHRITSIFGTGYYGRNFKILLAIYDMWAMGIDLLPRDMQTTFESLNGKFKDLKYI